VREHRGHAAAIPLPATGYRLAASGFSVRAPCCTQQPAGSDIALPHPAPRLCFCAHARDDAGLADAGPLGGVPC